MPAPRQLRSRAPRAVPRVIPATATIIVTGWTFGIAANTTRPAAAAAARAATRASSRLRLGPVSIAAMTSVTATTAARVTSSSMESLDPRRRRAARSGRRRSRARPSRRRRRTRASWLTTTTPAPAAARPRTRPARSPFRRPSTPRVGSSSTTRSGRIAVTVAIASRCRSPLDRSRGCSDRRPFELEPLQLRRPRCARRAAGATPRFLRPYSTSSSAVSCSR